MLALKDAGHPATANRKCTPQPSLSARPAAARLLNLPEISDLRLRRQLPEWRNW